MNTQAIIRLCCDMSSAFIGLAYFIQSSYKLRARLDDETVRPSLSSLKTLVRPGVFTFTESAVRNALYLWLVHGIISMSADYATAWGIFNTIRWGLVMVPVQALEASSLAFVGHRWGAWRANTGAQIRRTNMTRPELISTIAVHSYLLYADAHLEIMQPAFKSVALALVVEVPLCVFFSIWGAESFAFWLSESDPVARITGEMWKV